MSRRIAAYSQCGNDVSAKDSLKKRKLLALELQSNCAECHTIVQNAVQWSNNRHVDIKLVTSNFRGGAMK